jgi:hypothetical protein
MTRRLLKQSRTVLGISTPTIICDVGPSKVKPMENWSESGTPE